MEIADKKLIVENLHERLKKASIVILTEYKGLNVASVSNLRQQLKDAGIEYQVVKNTLLRRASQGTTAEVMSGLYEGPTAIALSFSDPVTPAKILTKFADSNGKLVLKAAALDGKLLNEEDIKSLSALPSREVLLSQVLGVMNAVPTSFVRVLSAVPRSLLYALQALKDKKEASS